MGYFSEIIRDSRPARQPAAPHSPVAPLPVGGGDVSAADRPATTPRQGERRPARIQPAPQSGSALDISEQGEAPPASLDQVSVDRSPRDNRDEGIPPATQPYFKSKDTPTDKANRVTPHVERAQGLEFVDEGSGNWQKTTTEGAEGDRPMKESAGTPQPPQTDPTGVSNEAAPSPGDVSTPPGDQPPAKPSLESSQTESRPDPAESGEPSSSPQYEDAEPFTSDRHTLDSRKEGTASPVEKSHDPGSPAELESDRATVSEETQAERFSNHPSAFTPQDEPASSGYEREPPLFYAPQPAPQSKAEHVSETRVHIGQIDIVVQAPQKPAKPEPAKPTPNWSSRLYLRRA